MFKKNHDKCPKCKCKETKEQRWLHDGQFFLEENIIKCKKCGNVKYHWAYGNKYVEDWKDLTYPPFMYRVKNKIKRLFKKDDELQI